MLSKIHLSTKGLDGGRKEDGDGRRWIFEMRETPTKFAICKLDSIIISSDINNNYLKTFLDGI